MKLINKTANGQIAFCEIHQCYHLEFGNLFINLSGSELGALRSYIQSTDYQFYLEWNKQAMNRRKILLNIGSRKIYFCLHAAEFVELNDLLFMKKAQGFLTNREVISADIVYN
jgi:hypothetical protein